MPAYCFGEELTYWTLDAGTSFRLWLNRFNIPGTIFVGKFWFLPDNNIDITVVIGKPINLPHIENPTEDQVDQYHELYMKTLTEIFDRNKVKYGSTHSADATLEIM